MSFIYLSQLKMYLYASSQYMKKNFYKTLEILDYSKTKRSNPRYVVTGNSRKSLE